LQITSHYTELGQVAFMFRISWDSMIMSKIRLIPLLENQFQIRLTELKNIQNEVVFSLPLTNRSHHSKREAPLR